MKEFIYILNYNAGKIYKIEIVDDDITDIEDYLKQQYGINADECSWMFSTNDIIKIETLDKII